MGHGAWGIQNCCRYDGGCCRYDRYPCADDGGCCRYDRDPCADDGGCCRYDRGFVCDNADIFVINNYSYFQVNRPHLL